MNLDQVRQRGAKRKKKRPPVGRGPGTGSGKTAGMGQKGQQSRTGYSRRSMFEGGQMPLARRLPKRGFSNAQFKVEYSVLNLDQLEERFEAGAVVDPASIRAAGLIKKKSSKIKILARGSLSKKLDVRVHALSQKAREAILAAGGQVAEV